MKTVFVAYLLILFTDGTHIDKANSFYTLADCTKYINSYTMKTIAKEQMVLDDNLVWEYKTVKSIGKYCKESDFKVKE